MRYSRVSSPTLRGVLCVLRGQKLLTFPAKLNRKVRKVVAPLLRIRKPNFPSSMTPALPNSSPGSLAPRNFRASLIWMVAVSLALQIAAIALLHQYRVRSTNDHFEFGWEMGKIGQSIAQGRGFSSPYGDSTGPSAWEPPLYPFLIGGVFKLFGIYSGASAWALLTINSLFTALTCVPMFFIARRVLGARLALWSGWAWALNPYAMYWSIHWIWDTTFSPFLLTC